MFKIKSIVYGWGINDSEYSTTKTIKVCGKNKIVWRCPLYVDWSSIIERGFSKRLKEKAPTYINVEVDERFQRFSDFRRWVLYVQPNKDWHNCIPDKDLLSSECKIYSPDTVVYIDRKLNSFLACKKDIDKKYLCGVCDAEGMKTHTFKSRCNNPFTNKLVHIGLFATEIEAHKAWQAKKHEYACMLADLQDDPRVAKALRERYAPDKDWTNY